MYHVRESKRWRASNAHYDGRTIKEGKLRMMGEAEIAIYSVVTDLALYT